ncbi:MAG: hypothetical protein IJ174_04260 [Clostridia bacterium]|nr:hypothetical protein [Clostridia bacterium]
MNALATMIGVALWALIPGFIARKKGRSFAAYYFLSFLVSPLIAIIISCCVKNLNDQPSTEFSGSYFKKEALPEGKWVCKCGHENADSLDYCPFCRRSRADGESRDQHAAVLENGKWLCKCGNLNPDTLSYCPICRRTREEAVNEAITFPQ